MHPSLEIYLEMAITSVPLFISFSVYKFKSLDRMQSVWWVGPFYVHSYMLFLLEGQLLILLLWNEGKILLVYENVTLDGFKTPNVLM